ncbi:MAG: hypothetical protein JST26_03845 [Bacteroidetes bacterium]|nr:hypothetical protein [Bacteroidota bacterium]
MFDGFDIEKELKRERDKKKKTPDALIHAVDSILEESAFKEQAILHTIRHNEPLPELPDEKHLDADMIFSEKEIKTQCIALRLKFLDSRHYKFDIPYEAILKIKHLNEVCGMDLCKFSILAPASEFGRDKKDNHSVLFAWTAQGHYYLVHAWGHKLKWHQKLRAFPLRNFETLFLTVSSIAFITTMSLPTRLITLDHEATYWCGYRIATFFHLLIFYSGVTAYLLVGFNRSFSGSVWKTEKEYD